MIAWALVCLCAGACGRSEQSAGSADATRSADTLVLRTDSPVAARLRCEKVVPEPFSSEFRTVGTVRAIAGRLAAVAAPFDGRVTSACVQLGRKVAAGAPVFELASPDFYEASKTYFQALRNYETARKNLSRKNELLAGGVASQRDAEEALTEAENMRREVEQAEANLRVFNIDPAKLQLGQPLRVCSPIAGEVVACEIPVGQYVRSDGEPLATVADLSEVWVTALVKEKYFGAIRKGDKAEVYTDAEPGRVVWGRIFHIGEMLDEQTRSVQVLVQCDNAERKLKPGMFTSVHFLAEPCDAVLLPAEAVFQTEHSSYVYLAAGEGRYVRRNVEVESIKSGRVHVISGLSGGETVVAAGGIYLTESE